MNYTKSCEHGCGQNAVHITKGSLWSGPFKGRPVHQCAKSANACPAVKQRKIMASREKYGSDYPWQTVGVIEKRNQSNIEKYGHECSLLNETVQDKRRMTMIERYGVEEPTLNKAIRKMAAKNTKQSYVTDPTRATRMINTRKERYGENSELMVKKCRQTRVEKGDWIDSHDITSWVNYKRMVKYYTTQNYRKYMHLLNPEGLPIGRLTYHIDHMFSRKEGFDNNIDPKIVAHPANLRVIPALENRRKYTASCHTVSELMEKITHWDSTTE